MTPCDDDDNPLTDEMLRQICLKQTEVKTKEILDRLKKEGATAAQIEANLQKLTLAMAHYCCRLYHYNKLMRDADPALNSVN